MNMQAMTDPQDHEDEIVRKNLIAFREAADLSQADAAEVAGIALDNLRRYENGKTNKVPGTVLAALAKAYGHAIEDFMSASPPPARLEDRPVFFLRTRPGAEVDAKVYKKLQEIIEEANREVRGRKPSKRS
jgi:transcriptional regulator with XRE-family HTH domain